MDEQHGALAQPVRRHGDERGVALVAVMGILLVLLPLGAFAVVQCRLQHLLTGSARADVEGLYAAEAALAEAVAAVPPGRGVEGLLAGPDRQAGTRDDGTFPFSTGAGEPGPSAATVAVRRVDDAVVRIAVALPLPGGRRARVEALVTRAAAPFTPATVHVEGDWWGERTPGDVKLDGADHRLGDAPGTPTGPAPPRPTVSGTGPTNDGGGGPGGGVGATAPALPLDLPAVLRDLMREPAAVWPPVPFDGTGAFGTADLPQLTVLRGDVDVLERVEGGGVLVVDGSLHVRGTLKFAGLVVARGGFHLDPGATVEVAGAVWTGVAGAGVELRGSGHIVYSSEALLRADALVAGRLPRAAVVVGWREVL